MKHIHCPVNGWDCPYYTDEGHPCRCILDDPYNDCDDFAAMWDKDDDYIDDDWDACETCGHFIEEDVHDVAACCCCTYGNFYEKGR